MRFLSAEEAAAQTGQTGRAVRQKIQKLREKGIVVGQKIGNTWMILGSELHHLKRKVKK